MAISDGEKAPSVIWNWRDDTASSGVDLSKIRLGALGQGLIGGAIGTIVYYFLSVTVAYVAWGITALFTLIGLISPTGLYAKLKSGLDGFGRVVGQIMAWLLLVPVYYLFFTPFRVLFRRGEKDAMTRSIDKDADTYWVERDEAPKPESYERQF